VKNEVLLVNTYCIIKRAAAGGCRSHKYYPLAMNGLFRKYVSEESSSIRKCARLVVQSKNAGRKIYNL
jgi:hypothetical protein